MDCCKPSSEQLEPVIKFILRKLLRLQESVVHEGMQ